MLGELGKNLWIAFTVVMPGMFTYGAWRAILLLEPSSRISSEALKQIDTSTLATASIIVAIALIQQMAAMVVELGLTGVALLTRKQWPIFHALICGRFKHASENAWSENATRVIANFFLSTNIAFGIGLLLLYALAYERRPSGSWLGLSLLSMLLAALCSVVLRFANAKQVVARFKDEDWS